MERYLVDCELDRELRCNVGFLRGSMSLPTLAATQLYVRGVPLKGIHVGYETLLPSDPKRVWLGANATGRNLAIVARRKRF